MSDNNTVGCFDAVVAGSGLGGLSAALHLSRRGYRVAVIEQAARVGGLCGTHSIDGQEYVIACNDFGSAMPRWLQELGVNVHFEPRSTCIYYEGRRFSLPPTLGNIAALLPHCADLLRYVRAMKEAQRTRYAHARTLADLVNGHVKDVMVADLLKLPAYLMGVAPHRLRVDALNVEMEFGYGYFKPTVPEGGPQALANAMAAAIQENGTLLLETRYLGFRRHTGGEKLVETSRGQLRCRYLIEALPAEEPYSQEHARGVPLSMYCLNLDPAFRFPPGVHTHVYYPRGISRWFDQIDRGALPVEFGFHIFNNHLVGATTQSTANLYFYLPRGIATPDAPLLGKITSYLFTRLEQMIPGIGAAIRSRHFISPPEFVGRHAMSSRVLPLITEVGDPKPGNYCPQRDVYRAGASFYPPGDHGGAAVLSGRLVADLITRAASGSTRPTTTSTRRSTHESQSA
jgi:phytoene dehydrogenase-like protein